MNAEPVPARRSRRRWRRRLALMVGAFVGAVLLCELGLAITGLYPPRPRAWPGDREDRPMRNFEADPLVGWRMVPETEFVVDGEGGRVSFRADAKGRRIAPADAVSRPEPPSHTIVLAGDSFFWGAGVQYGDSLTALLEARYPRARVVNLAQPGFGVDQIMLAVEEYGRALRPDLVVVGIYPMDCLRSQTAFREDLGFNKPTFHLTTNGLARLTIADRPGAVGRLLEERSRIYGLWRRAQRYVGSRYGVGSWWELNAALLERLRAGVVQAGSAILFVHVPLQGWRPFVGLQRFCEDRAAPLVDPVALHPVRPAGLYYEPHGHFTAAGHRYLENEIAARIAALGLLR
ncbi:MAG: SGNH/GDSL hydrolase family protein [bacterium]|nr:SGNH/GDSL hydrolase family protein [bacterium]